MHQDVFFNASDSFEIAGNDPTDRIAIVEVEETDTKSSTNVLKDLDCVGRRLVLDQLALLKAVFIKLRVAVRY